MVKKTPHTPGILTGIKPSDFESKSTAALMVINAHHGNEGDLFGTVIAQPNVAESVCKCSVSSGADMWWIQDWFWEGSRHAVPFWNPSHSIKDNENCKNRACCAFSRVTFFGNASAFYQLKVVQCWAPDHTLPDIWRLKSASWSPVFLQRDRRERWKRGPGKTWSSQWIGQTWFSELGKD